MTTMSRRALLSGVATAALLPARTLKTVGVQLYTVRSIIEKNTLETLQQIEQAGYRECEVTWDNLEKIWPSLQQTKLKPVSLHLSTSMFTTAQDKLPAAMENGCQEGLQVRGVPLCRALATRRRDVMKKMAAVLNKAGAQAKQHGMTLAYHNHAFEFAKEGGKTLPRSPPRKLRSQTRPARDGRDVGHRGGRRSGRAAQAVQRTRAVAAPQGRTQERADASR
jgi:hypothetical protein